MALATDALRVAAKKEVGYTSAPWRVAIQEEVVEILRLVITTAETKGLRYFAINGTLLGATKFQGMIPWDDDSDLGVLLEDVEAWQSLLTDSLKNTPYTLTSCTYGWIVSGPKKGMLDLIVFAPHPTDGMYRMAYPLTNSKPTFWMSLIRKYEFTQEELFPLRRYLYDQLVLWGPADGRSICQRAYGHNVFEVNKRPDKGLGIHPYWPAIARTLNPLSQGCADFLAKHCPQVLAKLATMRRKK